MSDAVKRLAAAGRWPDPDLVDAVSAEGTAALDALRELVRSDLRRRPEEAALPLLIGLTGEVAARADAATRDAAAAELAALYRRYDDEMLEPVNDALVRLGPSAIDALEPIARDRAVRWYGRAMAAAACVRLARPDAAARDRVAAVLRELVTEAGRRDEITDAERSLAAAAVWGLAVLPHPDSEKLIWSTFAKRVIVEPSVTREAVTQALAQKRGPRPVPEPIAHAYRKRWEDR